MGRPQKYKERLIMSSVGIPDSLYDKLEEISKKKGISKNALIITGLLKVLDAEDVEKLVMEMDDAMRKKDVQVKEEQSKQEIILDPIIINQTKKFNERIQASLKSRSRKEVIETFTDLITEPVIDDLISKDLDFSKKDVVKKIEVVLRKLYKEEDYSKKEIGDVSRLV
jgi:fumarylacetoacetate (FAA) hydrolase family protein